MIYRSTLVSAFKWPLRPLVRRYFRVRNWIQHRFPQVEYHLFWKPRGRQWIDYYAHRLNKHCKEGIKNKIYTTPHFLQLIEKAKPQADLLKQYGIKPHHTLLDYGCGHLRLAYHILDYLNPGNYVGIDIAKNKMNMGKLFLESKGYKENQFKTLIVNDCRLKELQGYQFDYVWAHSVFTHMPREDILNMLCSLKSILSNTGQYLFTFSHQKKSKIIGKDYFYSFSDMEAICKEAGYHYEILEPSFLVDYSTVARVTLPKQ